jgi:hypothetical protein
VIEREAKRKEKEVKVKKREPAESEWRTEKQRGKQ